MSPKFIKLLPLLATMTAPLVDAEVRFDTHIKPIFEQYCDDCHSGWIPDGGLRTDTLENLMEGGKQGAAVIPGKPEKGWLINTIKLAPGRFGVMPPDKEKHLTDEQIKLIETWIAEGAR